MALRDVYMLRETRLPRVFSRRAGDRGSLYGSAALPGGDAPDPDEHSLSLDVGDMDSELDHEPVGARWSWAAFSKQAPELASSMPEPPRRVREVWVCRGDHAGFIGLSGPTVEAFIHDPDDPTMRPPGEREVWAAWTPETGWKLTPTSSLLDFEG